MTTYRQELKGDTQNIWLEYNDDGSIRAVYVSHNSNHAPKRLHDSIPLSTIIVPDREIEYWITRAKESTRELFYS